MSHRTSFWLGMDRVLPWGGGAVGAEGVPPCRPWTTCRYPRREGRSSVRAAWRSRIVVPRLGRGQSERRGGTLGRPVLDTLSRTALASAGATRGPHASRKGVEHDAPTRLRVADGPG